MKKKAKIGSIIKRSLCAVLAAAMLTGASVTANAAERQIGDVDGDGVVTSGDALKILRYSVGLQTFTKAELKYADFNGDGGINSHDALLTLQKAVYDQEAAYKAAAEKAAAEKAAAEKAAAEKAAAEKAAAEKAAKEEALKNAQPKIEFPETYIACCGDRINIRAKMTPEEKYGSMTFEYRVGLDTSDDGILDDNGNPYKVLDITNTNRIKAFHPGKTTIKAVAENGMVAVCEVTVVDLTLKRTIKSGDLSLTIYSHMMTKNDCYNETKDFEKVEGVVVHSTACPGVTADKWYASWNRRYTDAAVHSFLDNTCVYNYLPLDQTAWHAGQPANKTYLDFEICEPSGFYYSNNQVTGYNVAAQQAYFDAMWNNATLYAAYLCSLYNLTADNVISHAEAGKSGIGTNHGDPDHWFVYHNKDMDDFRKDVAKILQRGIQQSERFVISSGSAPYVSGSSEDEIEYTPEDLYEMFGICGGEGWRY